MSKPELANFIKGKITDMERTLKTRLEMQEVWAGGTNESWRAAGCFMSKAGRLKESAMHGRIAAKNLHELAMFRAVLTFIT